MSDENKPLSDKELIKWVSIIRAQRRLQVILDRLNAEHAGHEFSPERLTVIKGEIERELDAGRNQELGELVPIKVRADFDPVTRQLAIELYAEGETLPS